MLQALGQDWDERVLPSIGNEIIKAVVAQYNAEQLLTQRDKVSRAVCFRPLLRSVLICSMARNSMARKFCQSSDVALGQDSISDSLSISDCFTIEAHQEI